MLVQRKRGGGREIENHQEVLDALRLFPFSCRGTWTVVSPISIRGGGGGGGQASMQEVAKVRVGKFFCEAKRDPRYICEA